MRFAKVILIKTFDSAANDLGTPLKSQFHSAFEHPETPPDAAYRTSCETRCLLVFPDAYNTAAQQPPSARL